MSLKAILGQEKALSRLRSWLESGRIPHALLFHGPRGVGKAAAALAFAQALNGEETAQGVCADIHRIDSAYQAGLLGEPEEKQSSIKVGTVRHVIRDLEMRSMAGRFKAAILEDAHRLVPAAANAMLKSLEEPPPRTIWILTTHRPGDLLATIRSRCTRVPFAPLSTEILLQVASANGIQKFAAAPAVDLAEGSFERLKSLLENPQPDPESWLSDPLGPVRLSEKLPRELYRSRPQVEEHLHRMAWHLRRTRGTPGYASAPVRTVLREFGELRKALRSNADPRLVLQLAALRLQQLESLVPRTAV